MQTLALEGEKNNIRVNCLAPTAATAMTTGILQQDVLAKLNPAAVSPAVVALVSEDAPTRTILMSGAGSFECAHITMTQGIHVGQRKMRPRRSARGSTRSRTAPARSCRRPDSSRPTTN